MAKDDEIKLRAPRKSERNRLMTTETDNQERTAFEAWASGSTCAYMLPLHRWQTNGAYKDTRTYLAHFAWQVRAAVEADRQRRMPSDDEIIELRTAYDWRLPQGNIRFARALLSRYGSSQPAEDRSLGIATLKDVDAMIHILEKGKWGAEHVGKTPMSRRLEAAITKRLHGKPAASTERELRSLLAHQYAGAALYRDDGELQDNSAIPFIDFLRDSPEQISEKMTKRGVAPSAASAEVDAWRERFPAYEYRPQDECVSLKLSTPAASAEVPVYKDEDDFNQNASTAELGAWQRGWNACRAEDAASGGPCFCDRMYPDSNPDATCGDCPRDYKAAAPVAQELVKHGGLLPCPFCGGSAHLSRADETVNVRCDGWNPGECLGAGPNCYTEAEAVAGWNRRAAPVAVQKNLERK